MLNWMLLKRLSFAFFLSLTFVSAIEGKTFANDTVRFYCDEVDGFLNVVVHVSGQEHSVIRYSGLHHPDRPSSIRGNNNRCNSTAQNFQRAYDENNHYYTSGQDGRRPIICAASRKNGPCVNTLLSLPPGTNASMAQYQLFDMETLRPGLPLEQNRRIYIHLSEIFSVSSQ